MKVQIRINVILCIVSFNLVESKILKRIDSEYRENFQNLFDSLAKNDTKKGEMYRDILKRDALKEKQVFDQIKKELWIARQRSSDKKMNFHMENNRDIVKRGIDMRGNTVLPSDDDESPPSSLQFNEAVCKRMCVTVISELLDTFHNFQQKFIFELQAADDTMAYNISEKLGELSRKVYKSRLVLEKVEKNTPCRCSAEFTKLDDFQNKLNEGYNLLPVRFDKIEQEGYYDLPTEAPTTFYYDDFMGYSHRKFQRPSTQNPHA